MYEQDNTNKFDRVLSKLAKKDVLMFKRVSKKMKEILDCFDVENYKNLKHDSSKFKRVQVGSFVLAFQFLKGEEVIKFIDFDHHDKIYEKNLEIIKEPSEEYLAKLEAIV